MPKAVVHILFTIIALDLFRDHVLKNKRSLPLHYVFIGGIAGLLPDIDVPLFWLLNGFLGLDVPFFHRMFTHTISFGLIFAILSLVFYDLSKNASKILAIVSFGVFFHIFLDWFFIGTIMPFYPFSTAQLGLDIFGRLELPLLMDGLEAVVLLWWLWHEEKTHKISDFI
ncbi:MAG TPA: metal-dependent hydrolase [Candidatus Nanoarchaeia archaeon]|nr:metal-dependent hydrolase [Candidatus Nanoarchaeia archaeon]